MGVNYINRDNPLRGRPVSSVPPQLSEKLGSGLKAPLGVVNGQWEILNGPDKVKQDMYIVLSTPVGVRLFQPDFGSLLPRRLFETWGPTLKSELKVDTKVALETWVPQIIVLDVIISDQPHLINQHVIQLIINFLFKGTGAKDSLEIILSQSDLTILPAGTFTISGKYFLKAQ